MLPLEDPSWDQLRHAYGSAKDIPDLLRALRTSPGPTSQRQQEPWHELWSSLCHQGDVYTASYAAVPHIVEIASAATTPVDFSFFQLPTAIEIARIAGRGPVLPEELAECYHSAIEQLVECAYLHRSEPWDRDMTICVAAAHAVAKGHATLAEVLLNLDDDWIERIMSEDR